MPIVEETQRNQILGAQYTEDMQRSAEEMRRAGSESMDMLSESESRMNAGHYTELRGKYNYWQKEETEQTAQMPTEAPGGIEAAAEPATVNVSRRGEKEREASAKRMMSTSMKLLDEEADAVNRRSRMAVSETVDDSELQGEHRLLESRLQAIEAAAHYSSVEMKNAGVENEKLERRRIQYKAALDSAAAWRDYGNAMLIGARLDYAPARRARKGAIEKQLKLEKKAQKLRQDIILLENEGEANYAQLRRTQRKHRLYDRIKSIIRPSYNNALERIDAVYRTGDHVFVNVGRAYMGGTKPMYIFEDRNQPIRRRNEAGEEVITGYKQYLFKAPVNCIGLYKPEGSLVTEAASRLQERMCPHSINAICAYDHGQVIGSFQERIETARSDFDLFEWQLSVEGQGDHVSQSLVDRLEPGIVRQILREHALDWLLCNFDTKGENFLRRTDGELCSFDKEASFNKLRDPEAEHMSYTYKPHNNNTIYNTIFRLYAKGKLSLDFEPLRESVRVAESITDEEYLGFFREMLDHKYRNEPEKRREAENRILERKHNLGAEYERFIGELEREHNENRAREQGNAPS